MTSVESPGSVGRASRWIYQGIWGVLVRWFLVPDRPPSLPVQPGDAFESFQPSAGFLRYMKFLFWLTMIAVGLGLWIPWGVFTMAFPVWGIVLAIPLLIVWLVPCMVAYLAIHLRYDSTWYVMTERSLRIRRGIWIIHETTITFENVQNVEVNQGPLQRFFGIADVHVDTAGGGGKVAHSEYGSQATAGHRGLIEGISNAQRVRDLVLSRLRKSRTTGLGDESVARHPEEHARERLEVLREIRDLARLLARESGP